MLEVPEYDPSKPETLTVLKEDDVISAGEAKWFRNQLERLSGKNPYGESILQMRWGPTYEDPMRTEKAVKYLDFEHFGTPLGERRFFVEIWRSPEFLKRSGRYKVLHDSDSVVEFYFCSDCITEIKCDAKTLEFLGDIPPCSKCGSKKHRIETIREPGTGQLLSEFPARGCYDYWLRLERSDLTYHPPDNEALTVIRALWEWEQLSQTERDELEQADREIERRQTINAMRQSGAIYTGAVPFNLIPR